MALSSAFLPFFFANNEAIFESLSLDINSIGEDYIKEVFQKYGVELTEVKKDEVVDGNKKDPDDTGPNE